MPARAPHRAGGGGSTSAVALAALGGALVGIAIGVPYDRAARGRRLAACEPSAWPADAPKRVQQDEFVKLHASLHQRGILPISVFGEERPGGPIPRKLLTEWYKSNAKRVKHRAACLDFSWPKYASKNPHCEKNNSWSLYFDSSAAHSARLDRPALQLVGDLVGMAESSALAEVHRQGLFFDAVFCHFVFEHVAEPFKAARGLFNLVAPAGIVLWCAPSMVRSHAKPKKSPHGKSYGDYFRYTHQGAQSLLERAGFKIVAAESWGDNELSSAYLLGFGADDVGGKRLASRMRRPDGADRKSLLKNLHVWTFKTCVVAMKPEAIPSV